MGTEEGGIHRCTTAYDSAYLASYPGHTMGVYTVAWNRLHGRTFLSASADSTVRLWDADKPEKVSVL